jgi:hypothetical protein
MDINARLSSPKLVNLLTELSRLSLSNEEIGDSLTQSKLIYQHSPGNTTELHEKMSENTMLRKRSESDISCRIIAVSTCSVVVGIKGSVFVCLMYVACS